MASIHLNRHGYFYIRFIWGGGPCSEGTKVRAKKVGGEYIPENKEDFGKLLKLIEKISREIRLGSFNYLEYFPTGNKAAKFRPASQTFRARAAQWLADKKGDIRAFTHEEYAGVIARHLNPVFGESPTSDFSTRPEEMTRKLKAHFEKLELSPRSMKYSFVLVRAILKTAKIDFPIPKISGANRRRPLAYFTGAERKQFLEKVDPFFEPWFTVAFFSGMRPSEQMALREKDLDFTYKRIQIYSAIVRRVEGAPKTDASQRMIEMTPEMAEALKRWIALRGKVKRIKTDFLFCKRDGTALDGWHLSKQVWHPTLIAAELRSRVMYSTRHTFATIALTEGTSPAWVARQMGDNLATVIKNYFHFMPDLKR